MSSNNKAEKTFDQGAMGGLANTDFGSDTFDNPQASSRGNESGAGGKTQAASLAGEPVDERRLAGSGTISKGPEGIGETPGQSKTGESIFKKM